MTRLDTQKTAHQGLAHNMSAPPRSTFTFQPFGTRTTGKSGKDGTARACGLTWRLGVDPDLLIATHAPVAAQAMERLRQQALARAQKKDTAGTAKIHASLRLARLRGLLELAGRFAEYIAPAPTAPLETLLDHLADQATRLPRPDLPALGVVEHVPQGSPSPRASTTDLTAGLWLLTHVNGRTFDRDGPATLAPNLAEGGQFNLFTA